MKSIDYVLRSSNTRPQLFPEYHPNVFYLPRPITGIDSRSTPYNPQANTIKAKPTTPIGFRNPFTVGYEPLFESVVVGVPVVVVVVFLVVPEAPPDPDGPGEVTDPELLLLLLELIPLCDDVATPDVVLLPLEVCVLVTMGPELVSVPDSVMVLLGTITNHLVRISGSKGYSAGYSPSGVLIWMVVDVVYVGRTF